MSLDATKARIAVTGAALHGPETTTAPTDATTALNAGFKDVGYISDDGVVQSINSDSTVIKAWQNGDTVRTVQTSHDLTYKFTMIETNDESQKVYYGNIDATDKHVEITGDQLGRESWVLSIIDGADIMRVYIPHGQVTDRGDITYKTDTVIGYDVTITAYPDTSGVKAYIYKSGTDLTADELGADETVAVRKPRGHAAEDAA